jgi:sec-independent protein translocase protein TatA
VGLESPFHLLFIGVAALLVLGPRRLTEVARAAGKALHEFRESVNDSQRGERSEPESREED